MKRNFTILTLFLILGNTVFSQVKVRPGIRFAINVSNLSGLEEASSKGGVNLGVFGNIHFSDLYELQLELAYSNQGANIDTNIIESYYDENDLYVENIIGREKIRNDINYGSLGLMNKFFIANTGLHLIAGPSIDVTHDSDEFLGGLFPNIDFALTGGVGYEFPFGLAIEARYKQGLLDIEDGLFTTYDSDDYYYYEDRVNSFNIVFQFGVSYKFDFW